MRVVVLTNNQANQIAFINKLATQVEVAAIVFSKNVPRKKPTFSKRARLFLNGLAGRTVGSQLVDVWFKMQDEYNLLYPSLGVGDTVHVDNVNDSATIGVIEKHTPDLVVVSGTNLVGKKIIETTQKGKGIVNLHTGISPYVKGGPNCTNWCLAKNWFHLIGNTVMWLDLGIDTGNIIATEQTPLDGTETLFDLHWKVMNHAHAIYIKCITAICEGKKVPCVSQKKIAPGAHFYSADWNVFEMRNALNNFNHNYRDYFTDPERRMRLSSELKLFPIANE